MHFESFVSTYRDFYTVLTQPQLAGGLIDQHLNQTAFHIGEAKSYHSILPCVGALLVVFFLWCGPASHILSVNMCSVLVHRVRFPNKSVSARELYKKFLAACCAAPLPVSGTCAINQPSPVEAKAMDSLEPTQFRETGAHFVLFLGAQGK